MGILDLLHGRNDMILHDYEATQVCPWCTENIDIVMDIVLYCVDIVALTVSPGISSLGGGVGDLHCPISLAPDAKLVATQSPPNAYSSKD